VNRFIYTTKYENNSGLVDIFTFISKEKLALDLTSDWFQETRSPALKSTTTNEKCGKLSNSLDQRLKQTALLNINF
jgi:hypothetical protein